jgi:hypothetical protein
VYPRFLPKTRYLLKTDSTVDTSARKLGNRFAS